MTISSFAHHAQTSVKNATGLDLKRTHVYELLAAALGFGSHAALIAQGLPCPLPSDPLLEHYGGIDHEKCSVRAAVLGYSPGQVAPIATVLCSEMLRQRLALVPLEDILDVLLSGSKELYREAPRDDAYYAALEGAYDAGENWPEDPESLRLDSAWVTNALRLAASRGDGRAHLALGLLFGASAHADDADDFDDFDELEDVPDSRAGQYWYERQQKGEALTGVELEWAQAYAVRISQRNLAEVDLLPRFESAREHFNAAAALGQHDALVLLADRYGDDRFFDLENPQVRANPLWIAGLAERVGRYEWAPAWITLAAEQGNIRAMRELIECHDRNDPLKAWTWFHLAKLLGNDLTRDNYRAVHEDGSAYDDDVGGAMFAVGEDGVALPSIDESVRHQAQTVAKALFEQIPPR